MLSEERRHQLLDLVRSNGAVTTSVLADRFGVSTMTIRRDLDDLHDRGLLERVRGGAIPIRGGRFEPPFDESSTTREGEKQRIGAAASDLVGPGDTIIIDIGTTTLQLARHLHGVEGLTVVTSNLAVYEELVPDETIDILLLGGMVRRNYRSLVGFLTEDSLRGIRADVVFLGTSGISDDLNMLDTTVEEIPAKRAMLAGARTKVLLADGFKFWGSGLGRVARVSDVDVLITNNDAPEDRLAAISASGVDVRIA